MNFQDGTKVRIVKPKPEHMQFGRQHGRVLRTDPNSGKVRVEFDGIPVERISIEPERLEVVPLHELIHAKAKAAGF